MPVRAPDPAGAKSHQIPSSEVMSKLLFDSVTRYKPDADSGGTLRHNQICEILNEGSLDFVYVEDHTAAQSRLRGAGLAACHLLFQVGLSRINPFDVRALSYLGYAGKIWGCLEQAFRRQPDAKCLVNDTVIHWPIAFFARHHRLPWIALPQNLEVLWIGKDFLLNRSFWKGFEFEVDVLRSAKAVFTISYEEQFVLANLGLQADVLPYYPPLDQLKRLAAIRERRATRESVKSVLVIGSAQYPPTRDGLLEITGALAPLFDHRSSARVIVAGRGSEGLRSLLPGFVEVLGTVSHDELTTLMCNASAILVHQSYGGGALTRIPDALVAGIPVLANSFAARSARHYAGVHVYENAAELHELIHTDLPTPPSPPRPVAAEQRLARMVHQSISAGAS